MDDNTTSGATGRGDNLVAEGDGCPACGERDADRLVIDPQTEEHVDCTSCGHRYKLGFKTGMAAG